MFEVPDRRFPLLKILMRHMHIFVLLEMRYELIFDCELLVQDSMS